MFSNDWLRKDRVDIDRKKIWLPDLNQLEPENISELYFLSMFTWKCYVMKVQLSYIFPFCLISAFLGQIYDHVQFIVIPKGHYDLRCCFGITYFVNYEWR